METKEEILKKHFDKKGITNEHIHVAAYLSVLDAMNEYATQQVNLLNKPAVSGSLLLRSDEICLLEKYSLWLTKNGYMDTDWKDEEPFAIDEFLKSNDR